MLLISNLWFYWYHLKESCLQWARQTCQEEQAVLHLGENDLSRSFQAHFACDSTLPFKTLHVPAEFLLSHACIFIVY